MAIKLCKVSIKCFVMCLYKMYLTIASIFTLTSSLLLHMVCFYNRFLNHYQSKCCHWKLLQHAASGWNFLQFHGIDTLCNMKKLSSCTSNSSYIPSCRHQQWSWSLTLATLGLLDATGTSSLAFRAHSVLFIWWYLRFGMWALLSTAVANAAHLRWWTKAFSVGGSNFSWVDLLFRDFLALSLQKHDSVKASAFIRRISTVWYNSRRGRLSSEAIC